MSLFIIYLGDRLVFYVSRLCPLTSRRRRLSLAAFAPTASQIADKILDGLSHVFRHYISSAQVVD